MVMIIIQLNIIVFCVGGAGGNTLYLCCVIYLLLIGFIDGRCVCVVNKHKTSEGFKMK